MPIPVIGGSNDSVLISSFKDIYLGALGMDSVWLNSDLRAPVLQKSFERFVQRRCRLPPRGLLDG